jgi:two-component system response regulator FixJ
MVSAPDILLADADPAVRSALKFVLELQGFEVEAFGSGKALVQGVAGRSQGCLVIDQHLDGRDGLSLLARLRQRGVRLPAVLTATNPTRQLKDRAAAAGTVLVEKPLLGDALTDAVRALLHNSMKAA